MTGSWQKAGGDGPNVKDRRPRADDGSLILTKVIPKRIDQAFAERIIALRRLGFSTAERTSYGFHATASALLNESGKWSMDAVEPALARSRACIDAWRDPFAELAAPRSQNVGRAALAAAVPGIAFNWRSDGVRESEIFGNITQALGNIVTFRR